jgi:hypothetical protein
MCGTPSQADHEGSIPSPTPIEAQLSGMIT